MSHTFSVPDNCTSIKMESDGTVYRAQGGRVTVDNPAHVDEVKTSCQTRYGYMGTAAITFRDATGKFCSVCNFHAFNWSKACPRCGCTEFNSE